jgi:hypothetical protein
MASKNGQAEVLDPEQRSNSDKRPLNVIAHRFKPGESGNPAGRPKGSDLVSVMRRALEQEGRRGETAGERLVSLAMYHAAKGDFRYFKEIIDRMNGPMLAQAMNVFTGPTLVLKGESWHKMIQQAKRGDNGSGPSE